MTRDEKRKYWKGKVEEFECSGLSARAFCLQENLRYANLLRWRKELICSPVQNLSFEEILPLQKFSLSSGCLEIKVDAAIDVSSLSLIIGALCDAAKR